MTDLVKRELYTRNAKIIEIVLEEINSKCPNSIDLIGIAGSFYHGDIYENSDLDLVIIINNEDARILNKCFILKNIGFDIYTQEWSIFEVMKEYNDPYVTKLFDLEIIYKRNDQVLEKYLDLRKIVKDNMQNMELIYQKVEELFQDVLLKYENLKEVDDLSIGYRCLAKIISKIEYILYMINQTYVKRGVKRIPEEILNLKILPNNFSEIYEDIVNCNNLDEIRRKSNNLILSVKELLDSLGINTKLQKKGLDNKKIIKKAITSNDLTGTYEEIYSNWKNKMYHAITINSPYLSFITMASCQEFYDEMASSFDIPNIDLISSYDPNNLESNAINFDKAMNEWKELYDQFNKEVVVFDSFSDLDNLYKNEYSKQKGLI